MIRNPFKKNKIKTAWIEISIDGFTVLHCPLETWLRSPFYGDDIANSYTYKGSGSITFKVYQSQ